MSNSNKTIKKYYYIFECVQCDLFNYIVMQINRYYLIEINHNFILYLLYLNNIVFFYTIVFTGNNEYDQVVTRGKF